ncbi:MAG: peptide deformylase [Candidatus Hydrogenedentota bacterium]
MVLTLRIYPDPVLRKKSEPVTKVSKRIKEYVDSMFSLLDQSRGIGLAAQQTGALKSIIVLNVPLENNKRFRTALINPSIIKKSKEKQEFEEGCLSFPGVYVKIFRPDTIISEALDITGKKNRFKSSGLVARAIQHEIDHLNGILLIDHIANKEERERIEKIFVKDYKF